MKALVKKEARKGIWMEDVAVPEVGVNDADGALVWLSNRI